MKIHHCYSAMLFDNIFVRDRKGWNDECSYSSSERMKSQQQLHTCKTWLPSLNNHKRHGFEKFVFLCKPNIRCIRDNLCTSLAQFASSMKVKCLSSFCSVSAVSYSHIPGYALKPCIRPVNCKLGSRSMRALFCQAVRKIFLLRVLVIISTFVCQCVSKYSFLLAVVVKYWK